MLHLTYFLSAVLLAQSGRALLELFKNREKEQGFTPRFLALNLIMLCAGSDLCFFAINEPLFKTVISRLISIVPIPLHFCIIIHLTKMLNSKLSTPAAARQDLPSSSSSSNLPTMGVILLFAAPLVAAIILAVGMDSFLEKREVQSKTFAIVGAVSYFSGGGLLLWCTVLASTAMTNSSMILTGRAQKMRMSQMTSLAACGMVSLMSMVVLPMAIAFAIRDHHKLEETYKGGIPSVSSFEWGQWLFHIFELISLLGILVPCSQSTCLSSPNSPSTLCSGAAPDSHCIFDNLNATNWKLEYYYQHHNHQAQ